MHESPLSWTAAGRAPVSWRPWSRAVFDAARADGKPVLLFIVVPWSATCAAVESVEFARADLADLVRARVVPVRVDACARPDVSDRYLASGWPTVACLTPDGHPLTAATPTRADEIAALIDRASTAFASRPELADLARRASDRRRAGAVQGSGRGVVDPAAAAAIVRLALDAFDPEHGGFGDGPKIPHAPLVRLLLAHADRDERCRAAAAATLDAIADRLRDPADGGFFRAAGRRDWSEPDTAKVIEVHAELIEVFAEAGAALGEPRYLDVAAQALRFVERGMADARGGFPIDGALYVDAGARMARAYFHAASLLNDRRLIEFGVLTLERLMVSTYRPGAGVAHDGGVQTAAPVRGLLGDYVQSAFALAESAAAAGVVPHLMLAEELMRSADRAMAAGDGGFVDRVPMDDDVGLLREPLVPFALNCEAARVWLRLASLAEQPAYRDRAIETLASQTPVVAERGLFGAPYAIAALEVAHST